MQNYNLITLVSIILLALGAIVFSSMSSDAPGSDMDEIPYLKKLLIRDGYYELGCGGVLFTPERAIKAGVDKYGASRFCQLNLMLLYDPLISKETSQRLKIGQPREVSDYLLASGVAYRRLRVAFASVYHLADDNMLGDIINMREELLRKSITWAFGKVDYNIDSLIVILSDKLNVSLPDGVDPMSNEEIRSIVDQLEDSA